MTTSSIRELNAAEKHNAELVQMTRPELRHVLVTRDGAHVVLVTQEQLAESIEARKRDDLPMSSAEWLYAKYPHHELGRLFAKYAASKAAEVVHDLPVVGTDWKVGTAALKAQVGGKHYKSMAIEPVEFIEKNKIPFLEGNAIKYICRHADKNGEQDIDKAIHYLQLLKELRYGKPSV